MEINKKMINNTVDDVVSTVKFLCEKDLSYFELTERLELLNEKLDTLQTLVIYSDDIGFTNTICAMQIITDNFNDEIGKELGTTFSNDFRERQLNFLRNISTSFDIKLNEVEEVSFVPNTKLSVQKEYKNKVSTTKKDYQSKSTKETVDEIIKSTNEKIDKYFQNENDLKEYLQYMSKFHKYSIGNCSLIESQFSGAIAIGSFKFWKDNGFTVNKGEKGIGILVPTPVKKFIDENGNEKYLYTATKEQKNKLKNGQLQEAPSGMSYKKGYVFDVSQTNANAEDLPSIFPNKWIEGEVIDYDKLYHAMENIADDINVSIISPKSELGVAKGVSYTLTKEVALNPRNSQLQNVKTLLHELAHAKLHTKEKIGNYTKSEKEFQAEMVAYSVCSYFGLDTSDYSLNYLHHYTKGKDIKEKRHLLNEIKTTCEEFIGVIENTLSNDIDISSNLSSNSSDIDYESSDEIAQAIAEVIDAPVIDDVYVRFLWSEHNKIKDNSIYRYEDANEIIENLNTLVELDKNNSGYYKTKFEISFDEDFESTFYTGRFDIGSGYANNLSNHIDKFLNLELKDLDENKKNEIFNILGIKSKFDMPIDMSLER